MATVRKVTTRRTTRQLIRAFRQWDKAIGAAVRGSQFRAEVARQLREDRRLSGRGCMRSAFLSLNAQSIREMCR
jgi:hypothetical protein